MAFNSPALPAPRIWISVLNMYGLLQGVRVLIVCGLLQVISFSSVRTVTNHQGLVVYGLL